MPGKAAEFHVEIVERDQPIGEGREGGDGTRHVARERDEGEGGRPAAQRHGQAVQPDAVTGMFVTQILLQFSWGTTIPLLWAMMGDVADYLGNTPTVAKASYVDPRVVDLFHDGVVVPQSVLPRRDAHLPVHPRVERVVARMLLPQRVSRARAA